MGRIGGFNPVDNPKRIEKKFDNKKIKSEELDANFEKQPLEFQVDKFEKVEPETSVTYSKPTINQVVIDQKNANKILIDMADDLLQKQGLQRKFLTPDEMVEIDEETRAKVKELISSEGAYGVEAVSDRIIIWLLQFQEMILVNMRLF